MTSKKGERDRLIFDRDIAQQESKIGPGTTPVDVDEASPFTPRAELVRFSNLLREKTRSKTDRIATGNEIKRRMKQAEENGDKQSDLRIAAFNHLQSTKESWDRL